MVFQDVIQNITAPMGGGGRRRRETDDNDETSNSSIMGFLSDGGMDAIKEGVPEIMLNLLVGLKYSMRISCYKID